MIKDWNESELKVVSDEEIVEVVRSHGGCITFPLLYEKLGYQKQWTRVRVSRLVKQGLLKSSRALVRLPEFKEDENGEE